jgi:hypothetical protein
MLHVLVVSPECAQAMAAADYGIVQMLRLMSYFDAASTQQRCRTPMPTLASVSQQSSMGVASSPATPQSRPELDSGTLGLDYTSVFTWHALT